MPSAAERDSGGNGQRESPNKANNINLSKNEERDPGFRPKAENARCPRRVEPRTTH